MTSILRAQKPLLGCLQQKARIYERAAVGRGGCRRYISDRPKFNEGPAFRFTRPPHPDWKPGDGLPGTSKLASEWKADEAAGWKTWQLDSTSPRDIYRLLTSAVVPRPIAFVSTISSNGVPNLAPFRYFSMVAHNPPLCSISFTAGHKDTRENIRETREFTVNIISEPFVEAANFTSIDAPEDVDEWVLSGLTPEPSIHVKTPRVKESAVSLECELYHWHDIRPPNSSTVTHSLVLGHIKTVHARNAVLNDDGTIDPVKFRAVSRLGGTTYARIGEGFDLPRPSWKKNLDTYATLVKKGSK
ncbi:flavo protein oxygenase [Punctularia strigosozonata HHB-11173 SS5]|uniref:flavo protein oxygenase n=1 Tax=Punctularia strigosozonata (strain HHB-11173) TaxID=741275 RepID=UPI00044176B4|nr:flavo protein oxygenase [Punctularia strigosozonata HHB-11173 SS5]EIN11791.1 flavo protein oxygenase [Punctularia strigosozonata HHB-11173 SS5]